MINLNFEVNGQHLERVDNKNIVAFARNELFAEFKLDNNWKNLEPLTAQFANGNKVYDIFLENGRCIVPWEVLQNSGILSICLIGGNLLTTNTVKIRVLGSGVLGGLIPTVASPSVYQHIMDLANNIEEKVNEISKGNYSNSDVIVNKLYFKNNREDDYALVDLGSETGIRILNNLDKNSDWFIKIGNGNEKSEIDNGIQFENTGEFIVKNYNNDIIRLTSKSGASNVIQGNETLKIVADDSQISFDSEDAGISYNKASWNEYFKELNINTQKGVNIQSNNNSYFQTGEKKLVLGNNFNSVEFRTDGVAKFKNTINTNNLQIGGTPIFDTVDKKIADAIDNHKTNMPIWYTLQNMIRLGIGDKLFPVGTQFKTQHSDYGEIIWDVVAHNNNIDPTGKYPYSMTLYTHNIIDSVYFDGMEALYYCENTLSAGTYNFTLIDNWRENEGGGKTYNFTINKDVPAGGVLVFCWKDLTNALDTKLETYSTITDLVAIEKVSVSEGNNGLSLGVANGSISNMNHTQRISGSSNWRDSAVRQFLNSKNSMNSVWLPKTKFDRPPTWINKKNGFIYGLDKDFVNIVGDVDNITLCNNVYEEDGNIGGYYTTRDKFWIPSTTELFGTKGSGAEGTQFEYFINADKNKYIKTNNTGTALLYPLRSTDTNTCCSVYRVSQNGTLHSSKVTGANYLTIACTIY